LHCGRKALVEYVDLSELYKLASKDPAAAAEVFKAVGFIFIAVAICILAASMS
jgi:hypothetical protein